MLRIFMQYRRNEDVRSYEFVHRLIVAFGRTQKNLRRNEMLITTQACARGCAD
jgi:hypothetical protein